MKNSSLLSSLGGAAATTLASGSSHQSVFGTLPDGRQVNSVTLINKNGVKAEIINWGAALHALYVPDREGNLANVVLGYPNIKDDIENPQYFGSCVGRFANRIYKGKFSIGDHDYQVPTNDRGNSLHGGPEGFYNVLWNINGIDETKNAISVNLSYLSPDGDQGFPGNLKVAVTYSLTNSNELHINYTAETDKSTIINLTNHAYWDLSGEGSRTVYDNYIQINADEYLPVDSTGIPTGEFNDVTGTPFDFRKPKPIGQDVRVDDEQLTNGQGYDHNFVISRHEAAEQRVVAIVEDPVSGRVLTLSSTMPGLQFYSGNGFNGTIVGTSGRKYRQGDAFVLEPQIFPDTPNRPEFGSAFLKPGQVYKNYIKYQFSTK